MACSLAAGALAVPLAHADPKDLKHRQQQAQSQVKHARQDLDESSSRLRTAQAAVDKAVRELSAARAEYRSASTRLQAAELRDQEMQDRLDAAEAKLAEAEGDLAAGQAALTDQRAKLTDTVTDIYEQGDPQLLAFMSLLKSQSTTDLTRQEALNDAIVGRESMAYDDLHAAEVLLQVRENQVQTARDDVEVQRQAAADHLVTMERLQQEARDAKNKVVGLVVSRRDARAAAVTARRADLQDLQEAKRRENHVRQLILAAARRSRGGYTGPTNGLFIRPVPGAITSPFGYRIHPIYHYWGLHDGTDFGVSCGEPMRAVAGGTVIARYWSDVYGNRLYLSLGQINGKNVTAVYNHATSYRVGVGAHVGQGEVVGYVGSTGWSTGCHLHFTILVNGTAVDPMNWLP
ncbi:M23 family metallopeptidase [Nocardioides sp. URHA0032]|uniref:M23 family metallopeptidase n=1 Tax=Nocardioides sp. URHA0032 TaxID=1380388 RepID=UPI00048E389D|nr:M23 family metallopeptidase [Nocardioides sp. URHA0032]